MTKLSVHFSRPEFECKCGCGLDTVDSELIYALELVRSKFKRSILIISGARCKEHNILIGGAGKSQHLRCKAADFIIKDTSPNEVYESLLNLFPDKYGLGNYRRWTHLDVREEMARW